MYGWGDGCWEKKWKLNRWGKRREKIVKSGLKRHLERFKNQKFSYPGEGDNPCPGPHPPQPRLCGPRRVSSALRALLKVAAATCPPKFQVPSHFFILRRPDIYIYVYKLTLLYTWSYIYNTYIYRYTICIYIYMHIDICTCRYRYSILFLFCWGGGYTPRNH